MDGVRPPRPAPSSRIRHSCSACAGHHRRPGRLGGPDDRLGGGDRLGQALSAGLDEQPAATFRQRRDGGRTATAAHHLDQPGVHALHGQRPVRQHRRHRVGGGRHVLIGQHRQRGRRSPLDQADGGRGADRQAALGAGQEAGQVATVLGQQVLHRVARDLPGEPAELGADRRQVRPHQLGQPGADRVGQLGQRAGFEAAPVGQQQRQRLDVVGGAAVGQRVRTAGVVGDHPAQRAAGLGGRVRPEPQPVHGGGPLQLGQDQPGLHGGGAGLRVYRDQPVQVPGEVQHQAGSDGVAGARGAAAPGGHRRAGPAGHLAGQRHLLGMPGKGHHLRHHPVVGGVGGVLGAAPGAAVHLGDAGPAQLGRQRLGVHDVNLGLPAGPAGVTLTGCRTRPGMLTGGTRAGRWPAW